MRNSKSPHSYPVVSCLMITMGRVRHCERAIHCYERQTYPNTELIVVDDSGKDLSRLLSSVPNVLYVQLSPTSSYVLGELRNIALEVARGKYLAQWDDDDWYHPERLRTQIAILEQGYDACCLQSTLMHVNTSEMVNKPYIGTLPKGIPGTIVHRCDDQIRYPSLSKGEDTEYLNKWCEKKYKIIPDRYRHLFIRCYHGDNTWSKDHFTRRLRNSISSSLEYFWCKFLMQDIYRHSRFDLSNEDQQSISLFKRDSVELGLLARSSLSCT